MNMTHYMELLAANQPWNLLLYMALPVFLVETIAITEFFVLLYRPRRGLLLWTNRFASVLAGVVMTGIAAYLTWTVVVPLSQTGQWRGPADMIAVGSYLLGALPLLGACLMDLGWIGNTLDTESRLERHAALVSVFLVLAHIAMIFGMLDPSVLAPASSMPMPITEHHHH